MTKKLKLLTLTCLLFSYLSFNSFAEGYVHNKNEWGFYFASKLYEERNPIDNTFLNSVGREQIIGKFFTSAKLEEV